jgi:membrane protein implicated in regulation of membrane protease activity
MPMMQKPSSWADLLLTIWIAVIAVIFFGPMFVPAIGLWTASAGLLSLLMIMAVAVTLALRLVHRRDAPPRERPRNGKKH